MSDILYVWARNGGNAPKAQHIMAPAYGRVSSGALCGAQMIGWRVEYTHTPVEVMLCLRCANSAKIADLMGANVPEPVEHIRVQTFQRRQARKAANAVKAAKTAPRKGKPRRGR